MKYCYSIYGLNIRSDFALCGPIPGTENAPADVTVVSGKIEFERFPSPQKKRTYVGLGDECLFLPREPDHIALVVSRNRIIAPVPAGGEIPFSTQQRIMASALAAASYLRERTVFHGSVIGDGGGNAVIFLGLSGAGKSTIARSLTENGGVLLSDDHGVVEPALDESTGLIHRANPVDSKNFPVVFPGVPQGKLASDHPLVADSKPIIELENGKQLLDSPEFSSQPCRLRAIYIIRDSFDNEISFYAIEGELEKVTPLLRYRFRSGLFQELGLESIQNQISTQLALQLPVFRLYRPLDFSRLDELSSQVFEHAFANFNHSR